MPMKCQICKKFFGVIYKKYKLKDGKIVCIDCLERTNEKNHHPQETTKNICKYCNKIHRVSKGWS